MKTILVATDYSNAANNALDYAAHLAQKTGAEILLLNVYKLNVHASNAIASLESIDKLKEQSQKRLAEFAKETADRYNVPVKWYLGKDDTIESLKTYTAKHPVELVVMGIESNLIEYKVFGNTTTEAIRLMQFPLLVVPNDIQFNGIGRIMYACEASYLKDDCGLEVLKQFVRDLGAKLEVFHVLTDESAEESNEELERVMGRILHDVDHTYRYVNNPKVGDGIQEGLDQSPADLLVMVPHKLGFFESLFKGSHTGQMTTKTRVPLLVIPNEKAC